MIPGFMASTVPRFMLLCAAALLLAACRGEGVVTVERAWILMPPRGSDMLAGYGMIANGTGAPVTIERVSSAAFASASLHRTELDGDQARMHAVDSLTVPAGGRVVMSPGGLHLMLMRPRRELSPDAHVPVTFHLSDGGALEAAFRVSDHQPGG